MCYQLHITPFLLKVPLFNKNKALQQNTKGLEIIRPLTFSSWNQIIKELKNIYKLKDLIKVPADIVSYI